MRIIAEAAKNFITYDKITTEQALRNAKELAFAAKEAKADSVKFQCHVFEDEQHKRSETRYDWIKLNEWLTPLNDFWNPLKKYCDEIGIEFMVTPMSKLAAQKIESLVEI